MTNPTIIALAVGRDNHALLCHLGRIWGIAHGARRVFRCSVSIPDRETHDGARGTYIVYGGGGE